MDSFIVLDKVSKTFGEGKSLIYALKDVSFEIKEGEFLGVMGTSGSGKSTLLNLIATLDVVTSGKIFLNGKTARGMYDNELSRFRRDNIGFIFQSSNLLDTLTLRENIKAPLTLRDIKGEEATRRIEYYSKKMNIYDRLDNYPSECSGGEAQRAAACRAIVARPKFIIADEPTGALDSNNSKELMNILKSLNKEEGIGIIVVTHDAYVGSYCSRLIVLKNGEVSKTLSKGEDRQIEFYNKISEIIAKESIDLFNL